LENNNFNCGVQQGNYYASISFNEDIVNDAVSVYDYLEKIQKKLIIEGIKLEYIPDQYVHERKFYDDNKGEMQSLIKNIRTLKGMHMSDLEKFSETLQLNPGTLELIRILKSTGFKIALLSSGFNFFIKRLFEAAGVDYAFSNTLKIDENGIITDELEEPVITGITKNEILEFIMNLENVNRDQVIAVGDGSTSSHFIKNGGLSIAFKPGETGVKTDGIFSSDQIINLLYCLGIPKTELDKYLKEVLG
jgi:phosphoserine phosphatase